MSDDYMAVFNKDSSGKEYVEMVSQQRFGKLSTKVSNVGKYSTIYIGVTSSHELFMGLQDQVDSYFEIKTAYVAAASLNKDKTLVSQYLLESGAKGIEIIQSSSNPHEVKIRWNQVF